MTLRDFRIGWRLLLQQPAYSIVVTGGLAIGFAACFLLFGFVAFCLNYNSSLPDNDRLMVVKQRINVFPRPEWQTVGYLPLRDIALASGLVERASIVRSIDRPLRAAGTLHAMDLSVVDPAFGPLFGISASAGDLQAALTQPDGLALTKTAARKLFGEAPALGQSVNVGDNVLQVRALLYDPPANSSQFYEALIGSKSSAWPERETAFANWSRGTVYMKLKPGAPMEALATLLQDATEKSPMNHRVKAGPMGAALNGRNVSDIKLLRLRDAYFDQELLNSRAAQRHGQRSTVFGMAAGGLLILLLAAINYVNLATVRTLRRQREIGLRKLLGASAARLVRQFLSEAVLTALIATVAGLMLAWLLLPVFSDMVNRPLDGMFTPLRCVIALVFGVFIGICAGAYPAWIALHSLPGTSLTGRDNSETVAGLWVRRVLTVLQFASAMTLGATALAVGWQTWYASHASPGFDTANLLALPLPDGAEGNPAATAFIEQLRRVQGVQAVAAISEAVGRDGMKVISTVVGKDGREIPMEAKYVSPNWFEVHRIRALYGELFNPAHDPKDTKDLGGVVLNQAGALALGYASPRDAVGQATPSGLRINGIAPDIRFQGLRQPAKAIIYGIRPAGMLSVRTDGRLADAYGAIEPVWRRHFPDDILQITSQEAVLAEPYTDDARLVRILVTTSVVAIALAAFGIYVLSAYSVQRSRREIVMRKLHGARRLDIALMMGREFLSLIGVGALLGLPLAALAIERYLAGYTERAPIGMWTLAAALAMASLQGRARELEVIAVDPAFERIAGLRAREGNLQQALTLPDGLAVTHRTALALFGTFDALGKTVDIDGQTLQVRAVLDDRPGNSTLQFGAMVGIGSALWPDAERQRALSNWMGIEGRIYVKTGDGVSAQALQKVLQDVVDQAPWGDIATPEMKAALGGRKMVDIGLGPLADAYFDRSVANTMGTGPRGDKRLVLAMGAAGLLILAIAVVNYVNLATVRTLRRQREIAMRRVLGATTRRLLTQFMAEAVLLSVSAAALGMLLAWLLLPLLSELLDRRFDDVFTPLSLAAGLLSGVVVGALAGLYPGWLARGVDMGAALAHRSGETAGGAWLRRVLTALQFATAMATGSVALAILWQTQFAGRVPPGFDPAPLLVVEMSKGLDDARARAFRDAVARLPEVAGVADSLSVPGRDDHTGTRGSTSVRRADGSTAALTVQFVSPEFFDVYDLSAIAGRLFDPRIDNNAGKDGERNIVINQAAVTALGWSSMQQALGQRLPGSNWRIVGVAPDIRWYTLREPVAPTMYQPAENSRLLTVRMRTAPSASGAADALERAIAATALRYFPTSPPIIRRAGGYHAEAYADDLRVARMLACATAVVFALAAFGIYVLAANSVQRRAREIVLRKLHGAGRAAIGALVGREFLLLTGVAALIGLPPAVLAIQHYLAPFVERTPLGGWAPAAALVIALLIVAAATARHTLAAMRISPARALRD